VSSQAVAVLGVALLAWAVVVSTVLDKRAAASLVRRGDDAPRWVKRANRRWLLGWLVVWFFGVALGGNDPNHREASVVVVPMILAQGPWAFWSILLTPTDLVKAGAEPEVAVRTARAGLLVSYLTGFLCIAAFAITFRA
jgi:polyferredoxin